MGSSLNFNVFNTLSDAVIVIETFSKMIVYYNDSFLELFELNDSNDIVDIDDFFSHKQENENHPRKMYKKLLEEGSFTASDIYIHPKNSNKISCDLTLGFYDAEHKYVYFVLKNSKKINDLRNFQKILVDFPEPKVVLIHDENLSIYYSNNVFEKTFGSENITFSKAYNSQLALCFDKNFKSEYLTSIKEQISIDNKFIVTTRIKDAAGIYHTATISGVAVKYDVNIKEEQLYCTINIIDESIRVIEALKREKKFFEVVQSLSNALLFRLDVREKIMYYTGSTQGMFELPPVVDDFPGCILSSGALPEESISIFLDMSKKMYNGIIEDFEFKVYTTSGSLQWFLTEYDVLLDDEGSLVEIIGKITNINRQKELENTVTIDSLTGCLTKSTFEEVATEVFKSEYDRNHSLFIIDIDNFKTINDNYGHAFGDEVLDEIGQKLRSLVRKDDLVGRIGGDEFMILIRGISNQSIVMDKANAMIDSISKTYCKNGKSIKITASIGISLFPLHGQVFNELYKLADLALYKAKNNGKNTCFIYDSYLSKGTMENRNPLDIMTRSLAQHFDKDTLMSVFDLLYSGEDFEKSLLSSLEILGKRFGVARCFILVNNKDDRNYFENKYQWCNENSNFIDVGKIPLTLIEELNEYTMYGDIFYCNDLNIFDDDYKIIFEKNNVKSFIYAIVRNKKTNKVDYIVGFDDCDESKVWSPIEIGTLLYTSKIIGQFCSYSSIVEIANVIAKDRLEILDNLNFYAYMIDEATFKLTYFNKDTADTVDGIKVGDYCYEVLRGRSKPCDDCPIKTMNSQNLSRCKKIIHNHKYDMTMMVNASTVNALDGKTYVFVASTDVTNFIKK